MVKMSKTAESAENTESGPESEEVEGDKPEAESEPPSAESATNETSVAEEEAGALELDIEEGLTEKRPERVGSEEEPETPEVDAEPEPLLPEPIPISADVLRTPRGVMGAFTETRPDDYVARLETSGAEWMTITDDSLPGELLTSAAAMCLWGEQMIWYQGENAGAFTQAFGELGPVFVRGQAGQWTTVSKLRSILRRTWA